MKCQVVALQSLIIAPPLVLSDMLEVVGFVVVVAAGGVTHMVIQRQACNRAIYNTGTISSNVTDGNDDGMKSTVCGCDDSCGNDTIVQGRDA